MAGFFVFVFNFVVKNSNLDKALEKLFSYFVWGVLGKGLLEIFLYTIFKGKHLLKTLW